MVLSVAALVPAGEASGHGRTGRSGYVSTISALVPPVLGVSVIVLGDRGEPLLRFGRDGVFRNARGASFDWHDRRIHWPAARPPQAVRDDPSKPHMTALLLVGAGARRRQRRAR